MRLVVEAAEIIHGFKPLLLRQHAPNSLFGTGARSARRAGSGEDFFQYRDYAPGESTLRIDWRQSARSDDIFIREQERLLPHRVYMDCDNSPAMQFNSRGSLPTKAYAAQRLLLACVALLIQGESHVMPLYGEAKKTALPELAHALQNDNSGTQLPMLKNNDVVFLASDFCGNQQRWHDMIRHISNSGAWGVCIQMLDPIEHDFPLYGRLRLESAEDDSHIVIPGGDMARPIYLARLQAAKREMQNTCQKYNWHWLEFSSAQPPRQQLSRLIESLAKPL
jgi:uncharacterized protein (DUF58 family)